MKTEKKSPKLNVVNEVSIVYKRTLYDEKMRITSSLDASNIFRKIIDEHRIDYKEIFCVMLLSRANQVLGVSEIGSGSTAGVVVNNIEIFQLAILSNASGIILVHNHPSGKLIPSEQDIECTRKIKEACKLLDIKLVDHIILSSEGHYSFSDEGII